jgi:hypothetical protein
MDCDVKTFIRTDVLRVCAFRTPEPKRLRIL